MLIFDSTQFLGIERKHRPWFYSCAIIAALSGIVFWIVDHRTPGGFTAGSITGLIFGGIALLMMLFATALWVNRWLAKGWWLFPRQFWLRGHLWLGALSVLFVFFHAGGLEWGGFLTQVLWLLTFLTLLTGVFGLVVQHILPKLLTVEFDQEPPRLQLEQVCSELRHASDVLMERCCGMDVIDEAMDYATLPLEKRDDSSANQLVSVARFYAVDVRPFLDPNTKRSPLRNKDVSNSAFDRIRTMQLGAELDAALAEIEKFCMRRRELSRQAKLHWLLHSWLFVHVPVSLALMVMGVYHAIISLYY